MRKRILQSVVRLFHLLPENTIWCPPLDYTEGNLHDLFPNKEVRRVGKSQRAVQIARWHGPITVLMEEDLLDNLAKETISIHHYSLMIERPEIVILSGWPYTSMPPHIVLPLFSDGMKKIIPLKHDVVFVSQVTCRVGGKTVVYPSWRWIVRTIWTRICGRKLDDPYERVAHYHSTLYRMDAWIGSCKVPSRTWEDETHECNAATRDRECGVVDRTCRQDQQRSQ